MSSIIRMNQTQTALQTTLRILGIGPVLLGVSLAFAVSAPALAKQEATRDTCVECHRNPDFLVQNKKLHDYYRQWKNSIHNQEGVTCSDCHDGNPQASDKKLAHGDAIGASSEKSSVNFKNVANTCGKCHEDILESFKTSNHFEHMSAEEQEEQEEQQGPTCVTCHGSIDVGVLNVNSVKESCARCHNDETENAPENPEKAQDILNHLLSVHRYYRYLIVRMEPSETKAFFDDVDTRMHKLAVTWHAFDLDTFEEDTRALLKLLKDKRNEIREKAASSKK